MTRYIIAIMLLASIACATSPALVPAAPLPTATATAQPTATALPHYVMATGRVYIRLLDGTITKYWLNPGSMIAAECRGDWCYITGSKTMFWRGCSSAVRDQGCERKP